MFYTPREYDALYNQKYALEIELKSLKTQYRNELANLENEKRRLENEIESLQNSLDLEKKERENDKTNYSEKIRDLEYKIRILKKETTTREKSLLDENQKIEERYASQLDDLRSQLEANKKECIEKIRALKDGYESKIEQLEKRIAEQNEEISSLKNLTSEQRRELTRLSDQAKELEDKLKSEISSGFLRLNRFHNKIVINIDDQISFDSGSSQLKPEIIPALSKITEIISNYPDTEISIEGHTDNIPINTKQFRNNWQLSTERALSVLEVILRNKNLNPIQFHASGFGEFQPVVPNTTKENRALNRRVDIVVIPKKRGN